MKIPTYLLCPDDDMTDPRGYVIVGPFPDYETAASWASAHASNDYWQCVELPDPYAPPRVLSSDAARFHPLRTV